mgnify:CR=1 FL=1
MVLRLAGRAALAGILSIVLAGLVVSAYWQFVKELRPCPFCWGIRLAYFAALLGLPALLAKWGEEASLWAALGWAALVSILSAYPLVAECVPCLRKQGVPFWGPLSAYHLSLIGAGAAALLASVGLLLPRQPKGRL